MNQTTPHLGAHSCLINNEKSNHREQLRIGTTLTAELMASTRINW
jgi:agmatine/peptidylarginine deiminase